MGVFADPTAHSSFLGTYLVRVLAYTAGMVVVLYIAAGLVKGAKPPINATIKSPSSRSAFWKTLWQRFIVPPKAIKAPFAVPMEGTETPSPIVLAKQTLPLDESHTAHVLDSPDGRWLLVTGPTGTQLHPLKRVNNLDHGNDDASLHPNDHFYLSNTLTAPKMPVSKHGFAVPDGWGRVASLHG